MATPSNFQVTPFDGVIQNTELSFRNLYLHQIFSGPGQNQGVVAKENSATGLGETAANNWEIYDDVGPQAKVVARAQGQHMHVVSWFNSFSILFESGRFKGSTFQVMGATIDKEGEWAIVGGTGDFAMACGIIKRKVYKNIGSAEIQELTISGYCKMQRPLKFGPWGGNAGPYLSNEPKMIESITIASGVVIDSFTFTYIDQNDQRCAGGRWGNGPGQVNPPIQLGPTEVVKEMSGTFGTYYGNMTVTSLKIVTTTTTYGPFGRANGTSFNVPVPKGQSIVGFFGRTGSPYLESIGAYTM